MNVVTKIMYVRRESQFFVERLRAVYFATNFVPTFRTPHHAKPPSRRCWAGIPYR
jgi:hypothetical protein